MVEAHNLKSILYKLKQLTQVLFLKQTEYKTGPYHRNLNAIR